ncbi:Mu transposase C-terminal domain-containing protein [Novilysobacter arseniciresistens]|uniref:Mu transposase C-terminal domain-containing protein n=1 Tax=Novilysobacter arseniciresistens TaxID=1385522 RepID=UPI0009DE8E4A|nr:Mu transposase C-terminal domain-containing protein [Lysobacter arseniciresistens]
MAADSLTPPVTSYAIGSLIELDDHVYSIEGVDEFGTLSARDVRSGDVVRIAPEGVAPGPHAFHGDLNKVSDLEIARAMRHFALLSQYIDRQLPKAELPDLSKALGVQRTQVFSALERLRRAPHFTTLIRHRRGRQPGAKFLHSEVEQILERQIKLAVRAKLPLTIKTIFEETEADCVQLGLPAPCQRTVRQRIATIGPELTLRRKHGIRRARERVTPMPGKIPVVAPLQDVEVDHSPLDIFVVSTQERVCIGRAYLTAVVDTFSRVVLGFNLGFEPPSALTVALSLTHAVLPKNIWLSERGLSALDWPFYGLMKRLRVDKAAEFKSPKFEAACRKWGIEVYYRNKKEDGGIIERFIGTVQTWCSQEPGASGSDPKKLRGERDRRESAHMTLAEAEAWLTRQILMRYHLTRHSTLGISPLQAWRSAQAEASEPRAIVNNPTEFFISFLPSEQRVINHDGVRLFNETYFSSEARVYVQPGVKRMVYYDPRALGKAYIDVGAGTEYIEVRYTEPGKERVSKAELEAVRKARNDNNPSLFSTQQRVALVQENRRARAYSQAATRAARRKEMVEQSQRLVSAESQALRTPKAPEGSWEISSELDEQLSTPPRIWSEGPV